MDNVMFSSNSSDWETPQDFFDELDREFHFTLDPCSDDNNCKCAKHYTVQDDGLAQDWQGETVFCNPPYGRKSTIRWVQKASEEAQKPNTTVVMLIPARTDTAAFHDYIYGKAEIRFVRGRSHFGGSDRATFPSMVVIFRGGSNENTG